jgi:hypothetical protein
MIQSQPSITRTTHTLPFNKLSPDDSERLCLWLVEGEEYLRCRELTEEQIAIVEGQNH